MRREAMRAPLISCPANSISKPSIRKLLSSENLFADHHYHLHLQQQEKHASVFLPVPSSPSRKSHPTIYTCICFICFFFIITIATFLHYSNIDPPCLVEHASVSTNPSLCRDVKRQQFAHIVKPSTPALKGLGTVFIKGTKTMSEVVVAHITESTEVGDLRLFLRTLYRSGVIARADTVLLFSSNALPVSMVDVIHEENGNFHKLLRTLSSDKHAHGIANSSSSTSPSSMQLSPSIHAFSNASICPFNAYKIKASTENESTYTETFWGSHNANVSRSNGSDNAAQYVWGSVVGFSALELNPDDTLHGFFDHPPLMLRRWACYQMLLGMVRHRFKHVLLTDVSGVAILGDPFPMVTRRKQGLYLSLEDRAWGASNAVELGVNLGSLNADSENDLPRRGANSHDHVTKRQAPAQLDTHLQGRRRARKGAAVSGGGLYECVYGKRRWSSLEEFERRKKLVNSGAIVGGIHQIRGLANTMVTEIVKVAIERSSRDGFPDNVLLSYLLHKSSSVLGKNLHLLDNAESFVHSLIGSQQSSLFLKITRAAYPMIQGNSKSKRWVKAATAIHKDICSSPADAMVYIDCIRTHTPRKASLIPA